MSATYGAKRKDTGQGLFDKYPLKRLVRLLCYEDESEARAACEFYGILIKEYSVPSKSDTNVASPKDTNSLNTTDTNQATTTATHKQIPIIVWKHSEFREPIDPEKGTMKKLHPQKMIRTIEAKILGATRLAICRGEVSGDGSTLSQVNNTVPVAIQSPMSSSAKLPTPEKKLLRLQRSISQQAAVTQKLQKQMEEEEAAAKREESEQLARVAETEKRKQEMIRREKAQEERKQKEEDERQRKRHEEERREKERIRLQQKQREEQKRERERLREEARMAEERKKQAAAAAAAAEKKRLHLLAERRKEEEVEKKKRKEDARRRHEEHLNLQRLQKAREEKLRVEQERERRRVSALQQEEERRAAQRAAEREARAAEETKHREQANRVRLAYLLKRWKKACEPRRQMKRTRLSIEQLDITYTMPSTGSHAATDMVRQRLPNDQQPQSVMEGFFNHAAATDDAISVKTNISSWLQSKLLQTRHQPQLSQSLATDKFVVAPHGRHVKFWKVAVFLPQIPCFYSPSSRAAISTWLQSRLDFGIVVTIPLTESNDSELDAEIRFVIVDATNNGNNTSCLDYHTSLFVIPPTDALAANEGHSFSFEYLFGNQTLNDNQTPRVALLLQGINDDYSLNGVTTTADHHDKFHPIHQEMLRAVLQTSPPYPDDNNNKKQGIIVSVSMQSPSVSSIDSALNTCCRSLVKESALSSFSFAVERYSLISIGTHCITHALSTLSTVCEQAIGTDHSTNHNNQSWDDLVFKMMQTTLKTISIVLPEVGKNLLLPNQLYDSCSWPAKEFYQNHSSSTIPNYFGKNSNDLNALPSNWLDTLDQKHLTDTLKELFPAFWNLSALGVSKIGNGCSRSNSARFRHVMDTLLVDAPPHEIYECERYASYHYNDNEKNSHTLLQGLGTALWLWHERQRKQQHAQQSLDIIYAPRQALERAITSVQASTVKTVNELVADEKYQQQLRHTESVGNKNTKPYTLSATPATVIGKKPFSSSSDTIMNQLAYGDFLMTPHHQENSQVKTKPVAKESGGSTATTTRTPIRYGTDTPLHTVRNNLAYGGRANVDNSPITSPPYSDQSKRKLGTPFKSINTHYEYPHNHVASFTKVTTPISDSKRQKRQPNSSPRSFNGGRGVIGGGKDNGNSTYRPYSKEVLKSKQLTSQLEALLMGNTVVNMRVGNEGYLSDFALSPMKMNDTLSSLLSRKKNTSHKQTNMRGNE